MGENNGDPDPSETGEVVKAVETSFRVIESLKQLGSAKATGIADRTGLSKGAVYKHLSTLMKHDFVVKDGSEYHLGFRFLDYGGWLRSRYIGSAIIKPQIRELATRTNEVAQFATHENGRIITLFRENGSQGVSTRTRLGRRLYLNQTAGGKAILSQFPNPAVERVIDTVGLPKATENTIVEEDELRAELETIREREYAFNREESTRGLVAVAVPLVPNDTVIGACSIAGPRHRMGEDRLRGEIAEMLLSVVNELELNIEHSQRSADAFRNEGT
jgi:DNA-binding IclR family transcriptional regulator